VRIPRAQTVGTSHDVPRRPTTGTTSGTETTSRSRSRSRLPNPPVLRSCLCYLRLLESFGRAHPTPTLGFTSSFSPFGLSDISAMAGRFLPPPPHASPAMAIRLHVERTFEYESRLRRRGMCAQEHASHPQRCAQLPNKPRPGTEPAGRLGTVDRYERG
jgi:hypothetical protein